MMLPQGPGQKLAHDGRRPARQVPDRTRKQPKDIAKFVGHVPACRQQVRTGEVRLWAQQTKSIGRATLRRPALR